MYECRGPGQTRPPLNTTLDSVFYRRVRQRFPQEARRGEVFFLELLRGKRQSPHRLHYGGRRLSEYVPPLAGGHAAEVRGDHDHVDTAFRTGDAASIRPEEQDLSGLTPWAETARAKSPTILSTEARSLTTGPPRAISHTPAVRARQASGPRTPDLLERTSGQGADRLPEEAA